MKGLVFQDVDYYMILCTPNDKGVYVDSDRCQFQSHVSYSDMFAIIKELDLFLNYKSLRDIVVSLECGDIVRNTKGRVTLMRSDKEVFVLGSTFEDEASTRNLLKYLCKVVSERY